MDAFVSLKASSKNNQMMGNAINIRKMSTNEKIKNKNRIAGYDLIRCFSALTIVAFHFSGQTRQYKNMEEFPLFFQFSRTDWGYIAVISFFMLSGATLYHKYKAFGSMKEVGAFYKSRMLRLFPMFWMIWAYLYVTDAIRFHNFFYKEARWSLLLSPIGMDGYASIHGVVTYYEVGEWFLGALIIMYLLYPIVIKLMGTRKRMACLISAALAGCFIYFAFFGKDPILSQRNVLSCLSYIMLGVLFERFREKLTGNVQLFISAVLVAALYFIPMPGQMPVMLYSIFFAAALYLFLFNIAEYLQHSGPLWKAVCFISAQSYGIFLLQHKVIDYVNYSFREVQINIGSEVLMLLLITAMVIIFAYVADLVLAGHRAKVRGI